MPRVSCENHDKYLFFRKIIAWSFSQTLEETRVIDTISKAKVKRNTEKQEILKCI